MSDGGGFASRDDWSLRGYIGLLKRRKWLIAQAIVVVPLVALVLSLRQDELYRSKAQVLVSRGSVASTVTGVPETAGQPERILQTQADLASVPAVADRVLTALKLTDRSPEQLLAQAQVMPRANSDVLEFTIVDRDRYLAPLLATSYAREYTAYRRDLDTQAIRRARRDIGRQIRKLERRDEQSSALYETLVEKRQELATLEALSTSNASLVRSATGSVRIRPQPARNAILGIGLGLILGVALAFLWEALDTRIRTTSEIERYLGLPLLARIPQPPRWIQRTGRLIMLAHPESIDAEAFRVLRTNFEFFNMEHGARTVMVTSATQGEGKSTTVANLALALARAGQRVVLIDLDLRRPILDRFFGLQNSVGLTDVVRGTARLAELEVAGEAGLEGTPPRGRLQVLTTGTVPANPGEFVGSPQLSAVLAELRERADIVLIDSPPLLAVGDAIALGAKVDGVIVLTRLNVLRRPMIDELRRALNNLPAAKLGFLITGAETEEDYRYGYGYGYGYYRQEGEAGRALRGARR